MPYPVNEPFTYNSPDINQAKCFFTPATNLKPSLGPSYSSSVTLASLDSTDSSTVEIYAAAPILALLACFLLIIYFYRKYSSRGKLINLSENVHYSNRWTVGGEIVPSPGEATEWGIDIHIGDKSEQISM